MRDHVEGLVNNDRGHEADGEGVGVRAVWTVTESAIREFHESPLVEGFIVGDVEGASPDGYMRWAELKDVLASLHSNLGRTFVDPEELERVMFGCGGGFGIPNVLKDEVHRILKARAGDGRAELPSSMSPGVAEEGKAMQDNEISRSAVTRLASIPGAYTLQSLFPGEQAWTMEGDGSPGRVLARLSAYIRFHSAGDAILMGPDGRFLAERVNYWVSAQAEDGSWITPFPPVSSLESMRKSVLRHARKGEIGNQRVVGYSIHTGYYDGPLLGTMTREQALDIDE